MLRPFLLLLLLISQTAPCLASGFSFSDYENNQALADQEQTRQIATDTHRLLSTQCGNRLKNKRIALMIGERHSGLDPHAERINHGPLFDEINRRLRTLGLKTLTREQINEQIADAERTAFLNNDLDAAISAAQRLKAEFLLQGLIAVKSQRNPILNIEEVFLTLTLSLVDQRGRQISSVSATADSYVANDALQTALQLVRDKADLMLAQLYNDYCRQGDD
ncbi:MAG: hypothetical protein A2X84_08205 [Desulfuromonadaceae bacterium GWC2_58_13]|nr:MAG: hypothetical protein A2X84_08205 [Desulfuromonadaceae bacterium GWC2_58_13]